MGWYLACGVRQTLTASAASGLWKSASICVRMTTPRFVCLSRQNGWHENQKALLQLPRLLILRTFRKSWKVGWFLLYRPSCQCTTIIFRQVKAYRCKPFRFSIGKIVRSMYHSPDRAKGI
jgi:hypothetical protein